MCCTFLVRRPDGTPFTVLLEDDGEILPLRWRSRFVVEREVHVHECVAGSLSERFAADQEFLWRLGFDPTTIEKVESVPCPLSL